MSRFGTRSLLRRYGEIDSRGYVIGDSRELLPVHVVLDDSQTLATQPVERRALIRSQRTGNGANQWSCVEVYANTPGGIIIESLRTSDVSGGRILQIDQGTLIPGATLRAIGETMFNPGGDYDSSLDVGGVACRCRYAADWATVDPTAFGGVYDGDAYADARIYVPNRHTFRMIQENDNVRLQASLVLRELDEVQPG